MTVYKAKEILRQEGPPANIAEHIEAMQVAVRELGDGATMRDVWRWAEGCDDNEEETVI